MPDYCTRCGRRLKNPESVARGLGSSCFIAVMGRRSRGSKVRVFYDWTQLNLFRPLILVQQELPFDHSAIPAFP